MKIPKFRSSDRAYNFAYKNKVKLDENGEKLIALSAENSYYYARLLKGRFELGEPIIAKDAEFSYRYAEEIIKGRFPLAEKVIIESALWDLPTSRIYGSFAFQYAKKVIGGRWKELECFILDQPKISVSYCLDIINDEFPYENPTRFLEAEHFIAKDPECAVIYAKHIIKGRWEIAEPYIAQDAKLSVEYMKNINNINYSIPRDGVMPCERFVLAEKTLALCEDSDHLEEYIDITRLKLSEEAHNIMIAKNLANDKVAKKYFNILKSNDHTLKKLLQDYQENTTVKEILQTL